MRNRVFACRSGLLGRVAIVAIAAATVAGCSEASRFGTPLFTGSTKNQRDIIGNEQTMPPPVSNGAITRNDLPPPNGVVASNAPLPGSSTLPPGDYVWSPDGVKPNGSASTVSYTPPPSAPMPETAAAGGVHVVASGETLYAIGRLYRVRPADIAALNGLAAPESIRVGQRLQIPGAGSPMIAGTEPKKIAPPTVVASNGGFLAPPTTPPVVAKTEPRIIPGVPPMPTIPVATKSGNPPVVPASSTAAVDDMVEPASADGTSFRWPVRGRIISGFGAKPNGEKNDGINLAVPEGTSVKAAEAGTVIYAGNELEGYGNLVLIRHADDWVSAYAHNSDIKVKRGDTVRRGQTIGMAGMSGSVNSPQVHFELRKKAKPVNPLDYLAGA
jgi:murein DD-endopeptidase MepM/ murein hydrolase activator NlpD